MYSTQRGEDRPLTIQRVKALQRREAEWDRVRALCAAVVVSDPPTAAEKAETRRLTNLAIRRGLLKQHPCEVCNDTRSQGHHPDYSNPLLVRWLCSRHHGNEHRAPTVAAEEVIPMALKIAKSETRGRGYRDDVIGDVLLAVAQGERTREGLERVCRRSIRREWSRAGRFLSVDADEASSRPQYAELWEALKALPPKHYRAVSLHFWGGLTQSEVAREMRVSQPFACRLIREAKENLKKLLSEVIKMPFPMPLVGESE